MALIACPECECRVSEMAWACPHCGFPVAEARRVAVEEVTGSERAKTVRQRSAAHHMAQWAKTYTERRPGSPAFPSGDDPPGGRIGRIALWVAVALVVVLQVIWLYRMAGP